MRKQKAGIACSKDGVPLQHPPTRAQGIPTHESSRHPALISQRVFHAHNSGLDLLSIDFLTAPSQELGQKLYECSRRIVDIEAAAC